MIEKNIVTNDGHRIQTYIWTNERASENFKGWVHIFHGMAEYAARYDEFALSLVAAGYAVVAHNHRGHGSGEDTILGDYGDDVNWQTYVQDISSVREDVCDDDAPYFIFAHSMGSFIAQSYLISQPNGVNGVVLSGSNFAAVGASRLARFIAKIERFRVGGHKPSGVLQFLTFDVFNQKFKPNRTECDWLSRDENQVDKYIADPLCGARSSTTMWYDFFGGFIDIFTPSNFKKIDVNVPLFIMGGTQDPVGEMGKGLPKLYDAYLANGQKNVTLKMFKNGRHEMLNEINKEEVTTEIIDWLKKLN